MREEWKDVIGYEGQYMVSSRGRVKSMACVSEIGRNLPTRIMAPQDLARYPKVVFKRGRPTMRYIHRLVLESFSGPCPCGHEARHLDGNRLNNNLSNLEWGSRKQNQADRITHGTACRGESHPRTVLTVSQVRRIRWWAGQGRRTVDLAREFGVGVAVISRIRHNKSWKHIPIGATQ